MGHSSEPKEEQEVIKAKDDSDVEIEEMAVFVGGIRFTAEKNYLGKVIS
jgi:hypothetical protein